MERRPVILFLCVHNAGRSRMAAAFARSLTGERAEILSGGSDPASEVQPAVVDAMREAGLDLSDGPPRKFTEDDLRRADVIVTMGCGESCPVLPGKRYDDWQVADPKGQSPERVRAVRDAIRDKVEDLLGSLGLGTE